MRVEAVSKPAENGITPDLSEGVDEESVSVEGSSDEGIEFANSFDALRGRVTAAASPLPARKKPKTKTAVVPSV